MKRQITEKIFCRSHIQHQGLECRMCKEISKFNIKESNTIRKWANVPIFHQRAYADSK